MRSSFSLGRLIAIPLGALVLVLLAGTAASIGKPGPRPAPRPRTVCVDAGHGGSDPGAVYAGMQEKTLTLDIAKRLQALLTANGFSVVMTRTTDKALSNSERASICDKGGVDSVLSVHLNASTNASADYFTALYGKPAKDRTFAQVIWDNYDLSDADGTGSLSKSGISQFASGLLLKSNAPAAIAETVFLSNPDEQALLSDGTGNRQQEIAGALYRSLAAWYGQAS